MTVSKRVTRASTRHSLLAKKKLGLMDMPDEILLNIISLIPRPYEHIIFPSVSVRICRLYTAKMYQKLCCSYGFGRSLQDGKRSWRRTFRKVLKHINTCEVETCAGKGVSLPDDRRPLLSDWSILSPDDAEIHRFLFSLGNVRLKDWVSGYFNDGFNGYDYQYDKEDGGRFDRSQISAIDWKSDSGVLRAGRCRNLLLDHLLLESAFACMPPSPTIRISFDGLAALDVLNRDGVTVGDFRRALIEWIHDKPAHQDLVAAAERFGISMEEAQQDWGDFPTRMAMVEESTCYALDLSRNHALQGECFLLRVQSGMTFPTAYFFQMIEEDEWS